VSNFSDIEKPITYLITKGNLTDENYSVQVKKTLKNLDIALRKSVSAIHIREKKLSTKLVFDLAAKVVNLTQFSETKVLVNERGDIALAANADGVHLTSNSIPIAEIRRRFPFDMTIGASTHSHKEAEEAKEAGADFVVYGPIFSTISKEKYGEPKGLERLKKVCDALEPFPVVALGGINSGNYRSVIESGAAGFAGISFFEYE